MTESLIHTDGIIVEYYAAVCPEWIRNDPSTQEHFRTECSMTGSDKQLLQDKLAQLTPDTCDECASELDEHYSVITWVPDERVNIDDALTMLEETRGYIVLKFMRQNEPASDFSTEYFDSDRDLFIVWNNGELTAKTTHRDSFPIEVTDAVLDDLLSHYPVTAMNVTDTPFENVRET